MQVNFKQYRAVDGKWQFVPVVMMIDKRPELVLIDRKPVPSKDGIYYSTLGAR